MSAGILPAKHVRASESLLGIGALVLASIADSEKSPDAIWHELSNGKALSGKLHGSVRIDDVVMALDFLYAIGAISLTREGLVTNATS